MRLYLRKNSGDVDLTLEKALERVLHIESVTRTEEDAKEPHVSAIQPNENSQLVNPISDLAQNLHTNQSKGKIIKSFHRKDRGQKNFCAEVSEVQKKPEMEKETIIAMTEAELIIDEPNTTVERNF